ncbi:ATP-binding protein [Sandaracinus amylolyticus]|uniref:Anti-sigma B factor RsbT n=1 Tax=Sandaracinus amylolyticus TaxID=927083 RepID=A0A0F6YLI2_9BACT|nr:ATP-binding protein [Sandaracinus amylolyticus]AKF09913.1 Anti-sigma B factor RsbT [Sandaracinus amylolyticus]
MISSGTASGRSFEQVVRGILAAHLGPIHADTVVMSAARHLGMRPGELTERDRDALATALARPLRLYLDETKVRIVQREVTSARIAERGVMVADEDAPLRPVEARIRVEDDVIRARAEARDLAARVGFDPVDAIKIATVVSELARNIVMYAGTGTISVRPLVGARGVEIESVDNGPGIPDLDAILGGRYRSRKGLGLGIAGSKRLLDAMDVQTGPTGTRIVGRKRVP